MNTITRVMLLAVLALGSGCAKPDWIQQTLVTVDVTGTWRGSAGRGGSAYSGGDVELTLKQSGTKVTGRFRGAEGGDVPIEGTVSGDRLTVSVSGSARPFKADLQVRGDDMIGSAATSAGITSWYLSRQR